MPSSVIRRFALVGCLCSLMLGCKDSVSYIEEPGAPRHQLNIDGSVQFHAEISVQISTNSLSTRIWAENMGSETARIETGACAFNVIAYDRNGGPVWFNRMPKDYICFDELLVYDVAPKEAKELTGQMYISGTDWFWNIPAGDWDFKIEGRTVHDDIIEFKAVKKLSE